MATSIKEMLEKAMASYNSAGLPVVVTSTDNTVLYGQETLDARQVHLGIKGVDRDEFNNGDARELLQQAHRDYLKREKK